ncbi:MAG: RNA methyltransferase [Crocinitomicaceae bacterium]
MPKEILQKGFFGIGVYQSKREENIGTLWRSAYILGASFIFTIDKKYKRQASDVLKTWRHIPLYHYDTIDDLYKALPYDSQLIGVEMGEESVDIQDFEHPIRAVYLLGAEDNGLPVHITEKCHHLVKLQGTHSLNVAVAGSIILHDRAVKLKVRLPEFDYSNKVKGRG